MANEFLVGIDIGTTGTKALVVDLQGSVLAAGYREYGCDFPRANWVEQDVDMLTACSMETCRAAVEKSGVDPEQVAGVSFSSQRCCTIFIDAAGRPLRPMISWQDNRPTAEIEEIRARMPAAAFYERTSMTLNTTWMIGKIMWFQNNEPEKWARTAKIVQLQDYVLKAWGAPGYYDDLSDAGYYGLRNMDRRDWDEELLEIAGVRADQLPEPTASATPIGGISSEAAARSGLAAGTPLVVGAGDQNCAAVGSGVVRPGTALVSIGTAGAVAAFLDRPYRDPQQTNIVINHAIAGRWQVEGYQAAAGGVYRWFRDEIATREKERAASSGRDVYAIFDEMIAGVPPGAGGVVMIPHFAGAATPRWNPDARGAFCGLSFATDRPALARAVMEGITFGVRDMLDSLLACGIAVAEVRILGGPTRSALWNQLQADVYGRTVATLETPDAAPLGAAVLAGVGAGVFPDIPAGADRLVRIDRTCEPHEETAALYEELFGIYRTTYESLESGGAFRAIADFQHRRAEQGP